MLSSTTNRRLGERFSLDSSGYTYVTTGLRGLG